MLKARDILTYMDNKPNNIVTDNINNAEPVVKTGKLAAFWNKIKTIYGKIFAHYPITMVMVLISTFCACIDDLLTESSQSNETARDVVFWLMYFFIYLTVGSFGIEAYTSKVLKKNKKICVIAGTGIMAVISAVLTSVTHKSILGIILIDEHIKSNDHYILAWNMAYFVLILLAVFYMCYKESGVGAANYFVGTFVGFIQVCITWGILALGFLALAAIFEALIEPVIGLFAIPQMLIIGLYVAPYLMSNVAFAKEDIGKFFEALIKYALLIITIIGAGIIYLYIIKTIITGIPSNEIFAICSTLFFVAIPVGFSCTAFAKDSFLQKIAYILPYIYAPFIILQGYSVFCRIAEYGLTPSRYMGIVLIVLEILYIVIYAVAKEYIDKLILVMMAVTAIVTLVPGINVNAASKLSQKRILSEFIKSGEADLSQNAKKIGGAYDYLLKEFGSEYIDSFMTKDQQEMVSSAKEEERNSLYVTYMLDTTEEFLPSGDYDYFARFSEGYYGGETMINPEKFVISVGEHEFGPFDISDEVDSLRERCNAEDEDFDNQIFDTDIIEPEDGCRLVITDFNFTEDCTNGQMVDFDMSGYIMFNKDYYNPDSAKESEGL